MDKLSRRAFLRFSTLAAAGVAVAACTKKEEATLDPAPSPSVDRVTLLPPQTQPFTPEPPATPKATPPSAIIPTADTVTTPVAPDVGSLDLLIGQEVPEGAYLQEITSNQVTITTLNSSSIFEAHLTKFKQQLMLEAGNEKSFLMNDTVTVMAASDGSGIISFTDTNLTKYYHVPFTSDAQEKRILNGIISHAKPQCFVKFSTLFDPDHETKIGPFVTDYLLIDHEPVIVPAYDSDGNRTDPDKIAAESQQGKDMYQTEMTGNGLYISTCPATNLTYKDSESPNGINTNDLDDMYKFLQTQAQQNTMGKHEFFMHETVFVYPGLSGEMYITLGYDDTSGKVVTVPIYLDPQNIQVLDRLKEVAGPGSFVSIEGILNLDTRIIELSHLQIDNNVIIGKQQ